MGVRSIYVLREGRRESRQAGGEAERSGELWHDDSWDHDVVFCFNGS